MILPLQQLDRVNLLPTLTYLQDISKVVGKLQQVFVPVNPHEWNKGLEVTKIGLASQDLDSQGLCASLDLHALTFQFDELNKLLQEIAPKELFIDLSQLKRVREKGTISLPEFSANAGKLNLRDSIVIADTLYWFRIMFQSIADKLTNGLVSPVLIYPHHFDLSLAWYPYADNRQISLGFSFGDDILPEPYLYITVYPESARLPQPPLSPPAFWQHDGFNGAVLIYRDLQISSDPEQLLSDYTSSFFEPAELTFSELAACLFHPLFLDQLFLQSDPR